MDPSIVVDHSSLLHLLDIIQIGFSEQKTDILHVTLTFSIIITIFISLQEST